MLIGVLMNESLSEENHNIWYLYQDISKAIIKYNGIPVPIILDDYDTALKLINKCDGIILQGVDNYKDIYLRILNYLYDMDIPTLGICLGMQMMGVLFNGELGHINNHKNKLNYAHEVIIDKKSLLYKIIKKEKIKVNSRHHDYLIKTDLNISGKSDVIEAIESKNRTFFLGVQWHPEAMIEYDIVARTLFDYFIGGCLYGFK